MISVCIATYNGEKYIKEQLSSILCQLGKDDEVIISDDGSSDHTLSIVNSFNDVRIRILHHQKKSVNHRSASHIYASANFEHAISHAQGDYIFLADQDDIWIENRVEKMMQKLQENLLVICNFAVIDENNHILISKGYHSNPISNFFLKNIVQPRVKGCCIAFKKEMLNWIMPFPEKLILHDEWIGIIAQKKGRTFYIDDILLLYRRHNNNVSPSRKKNKNSLCYKFQYRLALLMQVRKRLKQIKQSTDEY
jgi:glycosyltransferase involved in cell wall biosynthesis